LSERLQIAESIVKYSALQYIDGLYGYALILTRNEAQAEDLVQETYLRALRAFGRLRPSSNIKSWLFTILRNIWRNQIRHTQSGPNIVDAEQEFVESRYCDDNFSSDPSNLYFTKVKESDVRDAR
jgi:RNA polymerase sigma-70 factor (ECF subfamily)